MPAPLRIAQVSPLYESVPPKLYGGTERIASTLTEALVRAGHDVTLFASGDSLTSAKHVPIGRQALRLSGCRESLAPHLVMFEKLCAMREEFDIVHFHTEYMHFPIAERLGVPSISTMHGRLDFPEYQDLFAIHRSLPLVSISHQQRKAVSFANFVSTVYHGLDLSHLHYHPRGGDYLAFLGRISPEKGVEHAIEIAHRTGVKLKIAAKIETMDIDYYERMKPLLNGPLVEFVGEISDREKSDFLGNALALIFPITWPEPFGLVMIEAMATGTPVIAFKNGSVPEVIRHGQTGFIVDDVRGAANAIDLLHKIRRETCRVEVEERFSAERMASEYVKVYHDVIGKRSTSRRVTKTLVPKPIARDADIAGGIV